MWKYCICFIAAIGVLVLLYKLVYVIDGFYAGGCPGGSVWNATAGACRDPNCTAGQRSTRGPSGMICDNLNNPTFTPTTQADCPSGTTFDSVGKRCQVCTTLENGKIECRSPGTYDVKPTFVQGSINTESVKTDVLTKPAEIDYADWMDDPTTSSDLRGSGGSSSFLGSHYIDGTTKLITESDADKRYDSLEDDYSKLTSGRKTSYEDDYDYDFEDDYDLTDERDFIYDYDEDEDTTDEAFIKLTNNRKTAAELAESARRRKAYRDYMIYSRYMERPSDMSYNNFEDDYDTEGFAAKL